MSDPASVPSTPLDPAEPTGDSVPTIPLTPAKPTEKPAFLKLFDLKEFRLEHPQFEKVPDSAIARTAAAMDDRIISDLKFDPENGRFERKTALYLAVCHLLTINYLWPQGQSGRITSAGEGSVNTSFDIVKAQNSFKKDWWTQTPCGAMYWFYIEPYIKGGHHYGIRHYHPW